MEADVNQLTTSIEDDLIPTFTAAFETLSRDYSSILDPKYGIIAGFNCRVLGEDAQLFVNMICNRIFMHSFILRIIFAAASFSILVLMFCVVTLGARSYHNEKAPIYRNIGEKEEYGG